MALVDWFALGFQLNNVFVPVDSMSSHQHDSAYDSTDPDADGDTREVSPVDRQMAHHCQAGFAAGHRAQGSIVTSCSSDAIFTTFTNNLNRRCSEPAIFPSAASAAACSRSLQGLARSHDDCSSDLGGLQFKGLKKQTSDDCFLLTRRTEQGRLAPASASLGKLGEGMITDLLPLRPCADRRASTASKDCSCSSSCSLESAASNVSEGSVFTSSPLASPSAPRRSHSTKHQVAEAAASSTSVRSLSVSSSKLDLPKAEGEVKRRTQSMRIRGLGGLLHRGSMKRGETQKEKAFPCGPLQEDSQSEAETPESPGAPGGEEEQELVRRQRPHSAIEVFQHVDSKLPCSPPSYEQALLSSTQPALPQYRAMTVQAARELGRRSRPISMNEDFLLGSSAYNANMDFFQSASRLRPGLGDPATSEPAPAFRARAMSESVSRSRQDTVARRCSQPVFEELTYAKESYV